MTFIDFVGIPNGRISKKRKCMRLHSVLLLNVLLPLVLNSMEEPPRPLPVITLENKLSILLNYWTVIQEEKRSLVHGKSSGTLNPNQLSPLDINPESNNSAKISIISLKLYVTGSENTKTITKRYEIKEAGHYTFEPDPIEIFVIKKKLIEQPK